MSKMNTMDLKVKELLKKLNILIGDSEQLENSIDDAEDVDTVITCLEDAIDEFCETIEVVEAIRAFLLELKESEDKEEPEEDIALTEDLIRIAEMIRSFEHMASENRSTGQTFSRLRPDQGYELCYRPGEKEAQLPKEDSVAMLFYDDDNCRIFPFEHVLRICPWLNDHSVMRAIPDMKDLYYLYQEHTECRTSKGLFLVGPVVVIKLNEDHFVVTPDALDRHRVRKFMKDHTEAVDFEEGASYDALRLI